MRVRFLRRAMPEAGERKRQKQNRERLHMHGSSNPCTRPSVLAAGHGCAGSAKNLVCLPPARALIPHLG
jgi:hypothetical protein